MPVSSVSAPVFITAGTVAVGMSTSDADASSLEAAAGGVDPEAVEAFKLVGNETRLAILLALWEAHGRPDENDNTLSFGALYDQIDYQDRGNFRHHLKRLEGQYVRRTDDGGYQLRHTGMKLVQTVIGGAGVSDTELELAEIDSRCEFCGASAAVLYHDGILYHVCTDCDGQWTVPEHEYGCLNAVPLPPAGLVDRTADELIAAAEVEAYRRMRTMFQGLCDICSGKVERWLELCPDHAAEGICDTCGWRYPARAMFRCRVCDSMHSTRPSRLCVFHPAVIAFLYDHGVTTRWHAEEFDGLEHLGEHDPSYDLDVVSEDPLRVVVTVSLDGDDLRVTFDESVTVVDTAR